MTSVDSYVTSDDSCVTFDPSNVLRLWPVHTPRDIGYFGTVNIFVTS